MAEELKLKYNLTDKSFVIDIAGNDGALLNQFKLVLGCKVLNIDPAVNLMRSNFEKDIPIMCKFWDKDIVPYLSEYPMADIITATNVFAHVDNVKEFIEAAKYILNPTGKLILEFPYLIDFINNKEFDTVYFEHLSYFSITPLQLLCSELGLNIEDVSKQNIHGGSVRVTIGYGEVSNNVALFIEEEKKYKSIEVYKEFAKEVKLTIAEFAYKISLLKNVAGFAASAKGNTLLNCSGVHLTYIIDQTDEKIGKFSPGVKTPIYSTDVLDLYQPDYLVILSWNFADEIMNKCRSLGYKNKFIIPLPIFKII